MARKPTVVTANESANEDPFVGFNLLVFKPTEPDDYAHYWHFVPCPRPIHGRKGMSQETSP
jgi:hypothetical protein